MALFAEIDPNGRVLRVVVCDSIAWVQQRLGGTWIAAPATGGGVQGAAPGLYDGAGVAPARFVPQWRQPQGAHDAYETGQWVWHAGKVWNNLTPANVWEPGVTGWRDPLNEWPDWIQPLGAQDAYAIGAKVTFAGARYTSKINANVWSPAAYPAGWQIQP